jgi:hypothetical protein
MVRALAQAQVQVQEQEQGVRLELGQEPVQGLV